MPPVTRRAFLKGLVATGIGTATGTAAYGFFYSRHRLVVARTTIPVTGLPVGLNGLRVGLITDVHRSRWVSHEDVADAVKTLMAEKPDLIVLGGDYVTWGDRQFVTPAAEALAPLSAENGVYAVLGNHDDDHEMPGALTKIGAQVLRDARTHVTIRGEGLDIAGLRYWTRRAVDIGKVLRGAESPTLLLAHDPRRLTEAAAFNVPLVLSGHTHGGQVVLPGLGAVAAREFPVVAGVGRLRQTAMFVSRGVGTVYVPVRLNCPPEVAVLTLEAGPA
jgi:predicted MPP superfamily phosphohydrolase